MAIGLSAPMLTAKSTLKTMQEALAVTSNNLANASSTTYHKQVATLVDNVEILDNTGYYGTGVSIASITRTYSSALENSLRNANTSDGYNQTYLDYSSQVEDLIAPDNSPVITSSMTKFMGAIQDLATSPEDMTYRNSFISTAKSLSDTLNAAYDSLDTIRGGIAYVSGATTTGTAVDAVDSVNSILAQLSDINESISGLESNSFVAASANDLRDQRDALVSQLSKYMNINVTEDSKSRYTITTTDSGGVENTLLGVRTLASGLPDSYVNTLSVDIDSSSGTNVVVYSLTDTISGTTSTLDFPAGSGELKGYKDSYAYVTDQMAQLEDYASNITTAVNNQLALGFDLNGAAGAALFDAVPTSGIISVSSTITPKTIGASGVAGENGNGDNMSALWDYLNQTEIAIGTENDTLYNYSNSFINKIAQDVQNSKSNADTSSSTVSMYKNAIASVSGVSTDEELTNMLQIQQVYSAAAKLMSTIQTMYDTIISVV